MKDKEIIDRVTIKIKEHALKIIDSHMKRAESDFERTAEGTLLKHSYLQLKTSLSCIRYEIECMDQHIDWHARFFFDK